MRGLISVHSRRLPPLLLLGVGLLVLLDFLLVSPTPIVRVHSSAGGSVRLGNGVLLPPDGVNSGQGVRVIASPLELSSRGESLRMRFREGSRFRLERSYEDPPALRLAHRGDTGTSYTSGTTVYHRWGRVILVQQGGRLSWSTGDSGWSCSRGSDFSGYWLTGGGGGAEGSASGHVTSPGESPSCRSTSAAGSFPLRPQPPDYRRHVGALIPPGKLISRLARASDRGGPPKSLRDALGYWAYDRWGELYLYEPIGSGFRLTSAGPDGAFHSEDDRRWTHRLNASSD